MGYKNLNNNNNKNLLKKKKQKLVRISLFLFLFVNFSNAFSILGRNKEVLPLFSTSVKISGTADVNINYTNEIGTFPEYFGSNLMEGLFSEDLDGLKELIIKSNMNIMRVPILPSFIESVNDDNNPNHVNWSGFNFESVFQLDGKNFSYLSIFEFLMELNITIMFDIFYLVSWLSNNTHESDDIFASYPPNSLEEYEEFVYVVLYYLVNNMSISPNKIILEPFNEPDYLYEHDPYTHRFWINHTMDDTVNTFLAAYNATKAVSPEIRIVGMAEWDDGRYLTHFINNHEGLNYLDGITYHEYSNNYDIDELMTRGINYKNDYGLPVFVNEYGSITWGSNGMDGAVWNSFALTNLLKYGIQPLTFPFTESPVIGPPFSSMGLCYEWQDNWEIKPSFWIYSNILGFMKDKNNISSNISHTNMDIIVGKGKGEINIVITNRETKAMTLNLNIQNLPLNFTDIIVYNNSQEYDLLDTSKITGNYFSYQIPERSSVTIQVLIGDATPPAGNNLIITIIIGIILIISAIISISYIANKILSKKRN